jgi:hypothetical protein
MRDREIRQRFNKSLIKFLTSMLQCTSISSVQDDYEKLGNRTSVQEFDLHASHSSSSRTTRIGEQMLSLDQKILWMERLTYTAEVNHLHVKSLARKFEEKREANRELRDQIVVLLRENKELKGRNNELLNENNRLHEIIQNRANDCTIDDLNSMNEHGKGKLSRLKTQLLKCILHQRRKN